MRLQESEKRIRIAEACGWKRHFGDGIIVLGKAYVWIDPNGRRTDGLWKDGDDVQFLRVGIPNYLFDLNAMHEAWKSLNVTNKTRFIQILADQVLDYQCMDFSPNPFMCAELANATAAQRAEAFGRALNLW